MTIYLKIYENVPNYVELCYTTPKDFQTILRYAKLCQTMPEYYKYTNVY